MRLAILCHNLHTAGGRVVGLNFIRALAASEMRRFVVVASPGVGYEEVELGRGNKLILYRDGNSLINRWMFDTYKLGAIVKEVKSDVVFAMGNIGLVSPPCPQAILFHKSNLVYPSCHYSTETLRLRLKNRLLKVRLKDCLRNTGLVFCQTEIARTRFSQTFSYPIEKTRLLPNAVSDFLSISKEQAGTPEIFHGERFYNLFFLTKFYAHKNLESILSLYGKHRNRLKCVRCIVTVAPEQHPNARNFLDAIKRQGLQEHIVNVGPLKQEELAGYFYNADALLFPTLMESFSGTYLEAMQFGLPILTSKLDFAESVCGEAALYFDPWDVDDMLGKIELLRDNQKLKDDLIFKARERMKKVFKSWDEITTETIKELEILVRSRSPNSRPASQKVH